jgi:hypothetical protein
MNDHPERALTPAQDAAPRGRSRRRDAARTTGTTGRPTKRTEALVREVITLVATGTTVQDAAQQVGVDPVTLWRWRQRDPELDKAVLAARAAFLTRQVERIDEAAEKDWKAAAWLLERSEPSSWGKRVEVQVEGPGRAVVDPLTGMVIEPGMDVMALPSLGACKREVSEGSAGRDMHD